MTCSASAQLRIYHMCRNDKTHLQLVHPAGNGYGEPHFLHNALPCTSRWTPEFDGITTAGCGIAPFGWSGRPYWSTATAWAYSDGGSPSFFKGLSAILSSCEVAFEKKINALTTRIYRYWFYYWVDRYCPRAKNQLLLRIVLSYLCDWLRVWLSISIVGTYT